jgi:ATP-dependent helicase/nuclease subunit A
MSRKPAPTDTAARTRIVTDLQANLIVEAGAGSGKTEMLARRMAEGVASGDYELGAIAAVTFTRKSAAELRGRFQLALERLLPDAEAERAERIRAALSGLERFFAGTIHAFCARLLRERPVEAGVSPGFTELDEVDDELLRRQSWRDYRVQAKAIGDPDVMELLDAGITAKQLDGAFETMCLYEDVRFPAGHASMPETAVVWKAVEAFCADLKSKIPAPVSEDSTCKTQERAQRFLRQLKAYERGRVDAALLAEVLRTWESRPSVVQKHWPPGVGKQAEQMHEQFRQAVVLPFLTAWRRYLYARCVSLLSKARDAAREERRRRNALSFNDLLILTASVLRSNPAVRRALQRKYRHLFVDEFQDTDPIQAEIMFWLAAAEDAPSWRAVSLRPAALFVVGDPKQSIYRFRRADIDIYNEVRAIISGPAERNLVRLTTNFRSLPGICDWVNGIFKGLFPDAPTTHAPMFAPLEPSRIDDAGHPAVMALETAASAGYGDVPRLEADAIARYIRNEVESGRRTFGDFLILTRKKRRLLPYARGLEALQIPIEVTGAGAFSESEEVQDLALLLHALADPQDAVALVGVLRGRLFGLSDEELFEFRQAGGYFSIFCDTKASGVRACEALSTIRRWYGWTRMLPAGAALERIADDGGCLALAATSPGGVEAGDLLHAIDRVRAVVEQGFTLADAAAALASWSGLERGIDESTEVDSLPLEPGRKDVVRLMNLHKAKGLEAAVVFLVDPLGGFEPGVDVRVVRGHDDEAVGYFEIVEENQNSWAKRALAEPPDWTAHEAAERRYLDAELDRVFYVAATRARDLMVVSRYGGQGRGAAAWKPLVDKLGSAPALAIPATVTLPAAAQMDLSAAAASSASQASDAAHRGARKPSWSATSVTAELKHLPRMTISAGDAPEAVDPTRSAVPNTDSHRADAGMAWGTLIHGLLEHAMRTRSATREDLRRLAMWLTVEEPELRPVIDQAIDTVEQVAKADFWAEAKAAAEAYEEAPFAIKEGDAHVVTGTIDMAYRTPDGWRLVDYKTDQSLELQVERKYPQQLARYVAAWERFVPKAEGKLVPVRMEGGGKG